MVVVKINSLESKSSPLKWNPANCEEFVEQKEHQLFDRDSFDVE